MAASRNGHVDKATMRRSTYKIRMDGSLQVKWLTHVVKILLEYKADINLQNDKGWSSLLAAFLDIIKILLEIKAQFDLDTNDGFSSHVKLAKSMWLIKVLVACRNKSGTFMERSRQHLISPREMMISKKLLQYHEQSMKRKHSNIITRVPIGFQQELRKNLIVLLYPHLLHKNGTGS